MIKVMGKYNGDLRGFPKTYFKKNQILLQQYDKLQQYSIWYV